MSGWIVAAWLAGALVVVLSETKGEHADWRVNYYALLALWPIAVPYAVVVSRWRSRSRKGN